MVAPVTVPAEVPAPALSSPSAVSAGALLIGAGRLRLDSYLDAALRRTPDTPTARKADA